MKNIKIGVIGTNFVSDWFAENARRVDGVEVTAVYSRKGDTGILFAARHGISTVCTSLDDMLADSELDAVYVASPTLLHPEHSIAALNAGKHVICEKAIAPTFPEFLQMKKAAERSDRVLLEAMRPAYDPILDALQRELASTTAVRASLSFRKYSSRYDNFKKGIVENAFNPELKNSALLDIGIYPLWLAVSLFGEPTEVNASALFLSNGFEGEGEARLTFDKCKDVTVGYSKIRLSEAPSIIETGSGSLLLYGISQPERLVKLGADGIEKTLAVATEKNNMIYEISAFRDMIYGRLDAKPFLDTTERVMRTVDRIRTAQKR